MSKFENFQLELIIGGADTTRGWRPHEMLAESNSCMRRRGAQAAAVCLSRVVELREGELVSTTSRRGSARLQLTALPSSSLSLSRHLQWTFKFSALTTMWVESTVHKKDKNTCNQCKIVHKMQLKEAHLERTKWSGAECTCPPLVPIVPL